MRKNINVTIDGITKTVSQWCDIFDIKYATALWRINHNWPIEKVFTLKAYKGRNKS